MGDKRFQDLWQNKNFTSKLLNISIDEGHCITEWGKTFRPEYRRLVELQWLLPTHIHYHIVSATMSESVVDDIIKTFRMDPSKLHIIRRSNDRPNIQLNIQEMKYSAGSCRDVEEILRTRVWDMDEGKRPLFMVFADSRQETEHGTEIGWEGLPKEMQKRMIWFHSGMTSHWREEAIQKMRDGEIFGGWFTDAGGMGLDLPNVELVIQYRYVDSLSTLVQRFGRGARGAGTSATAIYLVEPLYFDYRKKNGEVVGGRKRKNRNIDTKQPRKKKKTTLVAAEPTSVEPSTESTTPIWPTALPARHSLTLEAYETFAMDLFVNAVMRGVCLRRIIDEYFANNKEGNDHAPCCDRCQVVSPTASRCCSFCNMALISSSMPLNPVSFVNETSESLETALSAPKQSKPRKFNPKTEFKMDKHDEQLYQLLIEWREGEALNLMGGKVDMWYGPQFFFSDDLLHRIVMLAHHAKLDTPEAFAQQVQWRDSAKYAPAILQLINTHRTTVMAVRASEKQSQAAASTTATDVQSNTRKTNGARHCKSCRLAGLPSMGHIASNKNCPSQKKAIVYAENHPLSSGNPPVIPQTPVRQLTCGKCGIVGHIGA
ncbi:hypothetical protein CVT24_006413 [Panaeolus cyanescens]|uniref:DNA 3'-5' helicase n=1 Tax=Panaeolus cyanescens TaxID=181874 RepID=A0A409X579_9AGAR|nr:hypothetical protein CVT24_006413 [Panaeolus cyanescens]